MQWNCSWPFCRMSWNIYKAPEPLAAPALLRSRGEVTWLCCELRAVQAAFRTRPQLMRSAVQGPCNSGERTIIS